MPENPQRTRAFPLHWLALMFLGLAIGFGLRLGAIQSDPVPISYQETAIHSAPEAVVGVDPASTDRRPRSAGRPARPTGISLTSGQAELLLAAPKDLEVRLERILSGAQAATLSQRLAEFFEWDEIQTQTAAEAFGDCAKNIKNLMDQGAVIDESQPGIVKFHVGGIADDCARETQQLTNALRKLMGSHQMAKLESLGMMDSLRSTIHSETVWVVRITPTKSYHGGLIMMTADIQAYFNNRLFFSYYPHVKGSESAKYMVPSQSGLPPVDWVDAVRRTYDAFDASEPPTDAR